MEAQVPRNPPTVLPGTAPTMLFLIGLGLADETDVTVKGLEVIKTASRVYLEAYTSILLVDKEKLVRETLHLKVFRVSADNA